MGSLVCCGGCTAELFHGDLEQQEYPGAASALFCLKIILSFLLQKKVYRRKQVFENI